MRRENIIQYKMRVEVAGQQSGGGIGRQTTMAANGASQIKEGMIQESQIERSQTGMYV